MAPPPAVEDEAPPVLPDEDHAMDAPASEDPEPPPPPPAESATSPECDIVVMAEVHAGPEAQAAGQTATDKATEQNPDQATEPVTDLANEQLADLAIAQPAEKATEQPADQATDLPTDVPTDLLIDIPVSCDQQPSITPAQADVTDTDAGEIYHQCHSCLTFTLIHFVPMNCFFSLHSISHFSSKFVYNYPNYMHIL